jgi:hypothetical protein
MEQLLALDLGPSRFLRQCHLSPGSGAELLLLWFGGCRRAIRVATWQQGSQFGNSKVDPALLLLKAQYGRVDNLNRDFGCRLI